MLGTSDLTKLGMDRREVVVKVELPEGIALQFKQAPSLKRPEVYLPQPIVDLEGFEKEPGIVEGGEPFSEVIAFL